MTLQKYITEKYIRNISQRNIWEIYQRKIYEKYMTEKYICRPPPTAPVLLATRGPHNHSTFPCHSAHTPQVPRERTGSSCLWIKDVPISIYPLTPHPGPPFVLRTKFLPSLFSLTLTWTLQSPYNICVKVKLLVKCALKTHPSAGQQLKIVPDSPSA